MQRKNSWQMAEAVGDRIPDATQRLLYRVQWQADADRDRLLKYIIELFGDEDGSGIADESGFIRQGDRLVGVKRQYSGTAGRIETCQIGTFLSYPSAQGHVFLDRRLYPPKERCDDAGRREQALVMLEQAWQADVPTLALRRSTAQAQVCAGSPVMRFAVSGLDSPRPMARSLLR